MFTTSYFLDVLCGMYSELNVQSHIAVNTMGTIARKPLTLFPIVVTEAPLPVGVPGMVAAVGGLAVGVATGGFAVGVATGGVGTSAGGGVRIAQSLPDVSRATSIPPSSSHVGFGTLTSLVKTLRNHLR